MPPISFILNTSACVIRASSFKMSSSHSQVIPFIDATKPPGYRGLGNELKIGYSTKSQAVRTEGLMQRVREGVDKVELSVSSYDTAWLAMVPSLNYNEVPGFPECIDWIIGNQHQNGSWGLGNRDPSLIKDALSSTLACIIALKRWDVGEEQIRKGIQFIATNFISCMDDQLHSPIGFDIIFPRMIENAMDMGLNLQVRESDIGALLHKRDLELNSLSGQNSEGRKLYLAYVAEGLGQLQDWKEVMKYQRKNGSLFNSPSTTAAAMSHFKDSRALNYLRSTFEKFGNSVPTVYPRDLHAHLCMVDNLEELGLAEYFSDEIKSILDRVHRCWVQLDEEITSDVATCAIAFRLLRLNGYNVSSGVFDQFNQAGHFISSLQGHLRDIDAVLELYKASQVKILANEHVLDKLNSWSRPFLEEELSKNAVHGCRAIHKEVEHALKFPPYANLERLVHKWNIENYNVGEVQMLKTAYTFSSVSGKDLLGLALEVFNTSQSIYRTELEYLESWVKENKLDQLSFARQKQTYCYLSAAATIFSPKLSDARISWAKNGVLTTVVDDFFDIGGTREEHLNLIELVEKWNINNENEFCSEQVKIVFSALHSTITELGSKASKLQNRSVTGHIIGIWLDLMRSMMKEADWTRNKTVPTIDEYMLNGYVSFALGPIIKPALYFVGAELTEDAVRGAEYNNLYRLVSTCGRLLNDIQGFEREGKEGKLNSVTLQMHHIPGSSEEDIKRKLRNDIESNRTELLRLVLASEGTEVPKACKELFWKMSQIVHLFYARTDGFTSPSEMIGAVNAVIKEPLQVTI